MSREQNEAMFRRFIDTMQRGDWKNQFADMSEDFRLTVLFPDAPRHYTKEQIGTFEIDVVAPSLEGEALPLVLHHLMHLDDTHIVAWVTSKARFKSGVDYHNTYVYIWAFRDGKCVQMIEHAQQDWSLLFGREVEAYWRRQGKPIPPRPGLDAAPATSEREQNEAIVRRFIAAMNRGDWEAEFADMSDDFQLSVRFPDDPHHYTKAQIKDFETNTVAPALEGEVMYLELHELMHLDDDHVMAWVTSKARFKTGVDYRNTYVHLWTIRDGKCVQLIEYVNLDASLLFSEQVGKYWAQQGKPLPRPQWVEKATAPA